MLQIILASLFILDTIRDETMDYISQCSVTTKRSQKRLFARAIKNTILTKELPIIKTPDTRIPQTFLN